jgi:hypothetical protein
MERQELLQVTNLVVALFYGCHRLYLIASLFCECFMQLKVSFKRKTAGDSLALALLHAGK